MAANTSLLRRVAWGSAFAASGAALLAALATIVLAAYLLGRAEDRRLEEAAVTFAVELDEKATDRASIQQVQRDETLEMEHTGLLFAVYSHDGKRLAGDSRLERPAANGCRTTLTSLRVCCTQTNHGLRVVVGSARASLMPLLAGAAISSALLAALLAWLASRPISRLVIAPLTRLRERIAVLDVDALSHTDLGASENVMEVDALRATIAQLIVRVEHAIAQAQRFAANAAHELRTPLTTVQAELELLSEDITESEARSNVQRAQHKLTELAELVERLLVLSVPARSSSDAHEVVSVRDLLEDTVAALPEVDRCRVQLPTNDALVRGDTTLLGTMIANALSNALKLAKTAGVELDVLEHTVVLRIDDDGPGIPLQDRERAFEPFFRAENALQRRVPGHGLGLALIRHIAQTHGGSAAFVDKRAAGARLEITLPLGEATAHEL